MSFPSDDNCAVKNAMTKAEAGVGMKSRHPERHVLESWYSSTIDFDGGKQIRKNRRDSCVSDREGGTTAADGQRYKARQGRKPTLARDGCSFSGWYSKSQRTTAQMPVAATG